MKDCPVIMIRELNFDWLFEDLRIAKLKRGQKYPIDHKYRGRIKKGEPVPEEAKIKYVDVVCAFDIETSNLRLDKGNREYWEGFMYVWQFQFGERCTIIGRTWPEFLYLVDSLNSKASELGENVRFMCYVHNLSFEFQFLSGIWPFQNEDVFAIEKRKVLYCQMGRIELRCSARLSGYSLERWAHELQTEHQKLVGNLDYNVVRYPWTALDPETELAYCVNDVVCVVECVTEQLKYYHDTLYSIPLTATGYIRRRMKAAIRRWSPFAIQNMQNPLYVYDRLCDAFRGGDTHANRRHVRDILGKVYSFDRSSSYPDVMVHQKFPMSAFREENCNWGTVQYLLNHGRAILLKVGFTNIRLKEGSNGDPYIPFAKCDLNGYRKPEHAYCDNGRIMSANYCELAMTDLDLEIISEQYIWDDDCIEWCMSARYGFLPQTMVDEIISLYKEKTALKGVDGSEVVYNHKKAEINCIFGMTCQHVISVPILFNNCGWDLDNVDRQVLYNKAMENVFTNYAWAVWVTAHARMQLYRGIMLAVEACDESDEHGDPLGFVYADTDSVKCLAEPDFSKYNAERIADAKASGAFAQDKNGEFHYMGVFESEGRYDFFGAWGQRDIAIHLETSLL